MHPNDAAVRAALRRDVVRMQIQEKAAALFATRGFSATTLQDIAGAVGMTRPALYHYVDRKEGLLAEIAEDLINSIDQDLAPISENAETTSPQRLRLLISQIVTERLTRPHRYLLFVRSARELPPRINAAYQEAQDLVVAQIERVLQDGIASGDFRELDSYMTARSLFGMSNAVVWWAEECTPERQRGVVKDIADLAVAGVSASAAHTRNVDNLTRLTIADLHRVLARLEPFQGQAPAG